MMQFSARDAALQMRLDLRPPPGLCLGRPHEPLALEIPVPLPREAHQFLRQPGPHHHLPSLVDGHRLVVEAEVVLLEADGMECARRVHLEDHPAAASVLLNGKH